MNSALLPAAAALLLLHSLAQASESTAKLAVAFNQLGFRLYNVLARQPGNVAISPVSIGAAMTMTLAGARGETQTEGENILNFGSSFTTLPDISRQLTADILRPSNGDDVKVKIANALHLTVGGGLIAQSYKDLLSEKYAAEIFSDPDVGAVNDWVSKHTDGKIKTILSRLDPNSAGVILNAIYFKGGWAAPFDAAATRLDRFFLSEQNAVQIATMHQTGNFKTLRTDVLSAIALPYKGSHWEMIILVPRRVEPSITYTSAEIEPIVGKLLRASAERVALSMPKFNTEFGVDLVQPLNALGMKLAFDRNRADFSGITGSSQEDKRIHISQIRHQTVIAADEAGTEAAAATAVEMATRAVPLPGKPFTVDRPFTYLIVEKSAGAVLFIGRVSDPRN